jgi:hypothetical protein
LLESVLALHYLSRTSCSFEDTQSCTAKKTERRVEGLGLWRYGYRS